jgi:hypothetical protein
MGVPRIDRSICVRLVFHGVGRRFSARKLSGVLSCLGEGVAE